MDLKQKFGAFSLIANVSIILLSLIFAVLFLFQSNSFIESKNFSQNGILLGVAQLPNPGFESGLNKWNSNGNGKIYLETGFGFSGENSAKVVVKKTDGDFSGITTNHIGVFVDKNEVYLFSVRIFIPPDEAVSGKFVAVAHVVGSDGCSGKRGCFRYSSIEEDNVLDSGTAKGKWITKYVRFRTDSDAEYFYPLVISDVDNSEGTFFVDDFKLERQ